MYLLAEDKKGLCFRCERRARFYETGSGPRCECQSPETAVHSCYMYLPVRPVMIKKNKGDRRSQFSGAMLSARSHYVEVAKVNLSAKIKRKGTTLYWIPE